VQRSARGQNDVTSRSIFYGTVEPMAIQQFRGGINELMKQAAWLQRKVEEAQKANKDRTVTATGANEKVKVTVTLGREITRIEVDPELLASDRELGPQARRRRDGERGLQGHRRAQAPWRALSARAA
jgi:hypothetical protein